MERPRRSVHPTLRSFAPNQLLQTLAAEPGASMRCERSRDGDGVVMFVNVVGFSKLSQRLRIESRNVEQIAAGEEKLSQLLNKYLDGLIDVIVGRFGGDVCKFVGDALMVAWPVQPLPALGSDIAPSLVDVLCLAVSCGHVLSQLFSGMSVRCNMFNAPATLDLHISISAGAVSSFVLCDPKHGRSEWVVTGDAVTSASAALPDATTPGATLVTPQAMAVLAEHRDRWTWLATMTQGGNTVLEPCRPARPPPLDIQDEEVATRLREDGSAAAAVISAAVPGHASPSRAVPTAARSVHSLAESPLPRAVTPFTGGSPLPRRVQCLSGARKQPSRGSLRSNSCSPSGDGSQGFPSAAAAAAFAAATTRTAAPPQMSLESGDMFDKASRTAQAAFPDATSSAMQLADAYVSASLHVRGGTLADETAQALRHFLPRAVTSMLDSSAGLTCMLQRVSVVFVQFVDIDGSLTGRHAASFRTVSRVVRALHGQINKWTVDDHGCCAFLVLPPYRHSSSTAVRAVEAALALRTHIVGAVCVGIATGWCFCGAVGSDVRREYTTIGSEVNSAAALMRRAARNEILCDDLTFAETHRVHVYAHGSPGHGAHRVDANTSSRLVVEGADPTSSRPDRLTVSRQVMGLVGRVAELKAAVETAAGHSRSLSLTLCGPAGSGKSTIIGYLLHRLQRMRKQLTVCIVYCDRHDPWTPLRPLHNALRRLLPPGEADSLLRSQPSARRVFRALEAALCESLASTQHVVMVIEDVHWLDPVSLQVVALMQQQLARIRIILTCEDGPGMPTLLRSVIDASQRKILAPFDSRGIHKLACSQLGVSSVPAALVRSLERQCGGLPHVVVELIDCWARLRVITRRSSKILYHRDRKPPRSSGSSGGGEEAAPAASAHQAMPRPPSTRHSHGKDRTQAHRSSVLDNDVLLQAIVRRFHTLSAVHQWIVYLAGVVGDDWDLDELYRVHALVARPTKQRRGRNARNDETSAQAVAVAAGDVTEPATAAGDAAATDGNNDDADVDEDDDDDDDDDEDDDDDDGAEADDDGDNGGDDDDDDGFFDEYDESATSPPARRSNAGAHGEITEHIVLKSVRPKRMKRLVSELLSQGMVQAVGDARYRVPIAVCVALQHHVLWRLPSQIHQAVLSIKAANASVYDAGRMARHAQLAGQRDADAIQLLYQQGELSLKCQAPVAAAVALTTADTLAVQLGRSGDTAMHARILMLRGEAEKALGNMSDALASLSRALRLLGRSPPTGTTSMLLAEFRALKGSVTVHRRVMKGHKNGTSASSAAAAKVTAAATATASHHHHHHHHHHPQPPPQLDLISVLAHSPASPIRAAAAMMASGHRHSPLSVSASKAASNTAGNSAPVAGEKAPSAAAVATGSDKKRSSSADTVPPASPSRSEQHQDPRSLPRFDWDAYTLPPAFQPATTQASAAAALNAAFTPTELLRLYDLHSEVVGTQSERRMFISAAQGVAVAEHHSPSHHHIVLWLRLGLCWLRRRRKHLAHFYLARAAALAQREDSVVAHTLVLAARGQAALLHGMWPEAGTFLRSAATLARDAGADALAVELDLQDVIRLTLQGEVSQALGVSLMALQHNELSDSAAEFENKLLATSVRGLLSLRHGGCNDLASARDLPNFIASTVPRSGLLALVHAVSALSAAVCLTADHSSLSSATAHPAFVHLRSAEVAAMRSSEAPGLALTLAVATALLTIEAYHARHVTCADLRDAARAWVKQARRATTMVPFAVVLEHKAEGLWRKINGKMKSSKRHLKTAERLAMHIGMTRVLEPAQSLGSSRNASSRGRNVCSSIAASDDEDDMLFGEDDTDPFVLDDTTGHTTEIVEIDKCEINSILAVAGDRRDDERDVGDGAAASGAEGDASDGAAADQEDGADPVVVENDAGDADAGVVGADADHAVAAVDEEEVENEEDEVCTQLEATSLDDIDFQVSEASRDGSLGVSGAEDRIAEASYHHVDASAADSYVDAEQHELSGMGASTPRVGAAC